MNKEIEWLKTLSFSELSMWERYFSYNKCPMSTVTKTYAGTLNKLMANLPVNEYNLLRLARAIRFRILK